MSRRGPNVRGRATIAAIEQAALALGESRAVEEITVAAICELAAVTERVFFNHFPAKQDAFLGLAVATLDKEWAAEYIRDESIPLLTGAARLVRMPPPSAADAVERRKDLVARNPALLARAHERLLPLRAACHDVVREAVMRRRPHMDAAEAESVARVIVGAAAELLPAADAAPTVALLRDVWAIML
jgi:AcrR family transcriptional regulator